MHPAEARPARFARIDALDIARGVALGAMAVFHFAWDLEFFGHAEPGMTLQTGWKLFARSIASTFLALVGVSLYLAHVQGIAWSSFARRFLQIAGAALLITAVTWYATPEQFIFFGILHQIALASLLGLAFLRVPAPILLVLAVFCIAAPQFLRAPIFDHPALWWIGLAPRDPVSNDYVPLFPWMGAVLIGIAAARIADRAGLLARLRGRKSGPWAAPFRLAGRHGLAFYLLHQPVLIGLIWLFTLAFPPDIHASAESALLLSCERQCLQLQDEAWCRAYCVCVRDGLDSASILDEILTGSGDFAEEIEATARQCQLHQEEATRP